MKQYQKYTAKSQQPRALVEDKAARQSAETLAARLRFTESLVEQQSRELRRLTAELSELREFVAGKLRR
jgi:Tfp pilus assembly major pilin PilA